MNFVVQLTEWKRRIQEYEGETFLDGMKIAVLASHTLESSRNMVRLAAVPAGGKYRVVRQNMSEFFFQFGRVYEKEMVEQWSRNPAVLVHRRWMLMLSARAMDGCLVCGRPGHAAKDCKFNLVKGKAQGKGKGKAKSTLTDKNSPAKFEGQCRHCGKQGH